MTKQLTVADFFCGAGGFSEGFNQAGFDVIFSLDNWKPAVETHDINHPNCDCKNMNILDLKTTEDIDKHIPDTDIIIGSPPCVSFSNSNKSGKADKTLGIQLIEQFLKIVLYKKTKPNSKLKYWIMENVPNSLNYLEDKDFLTAKDLNLDESLPNLEIKNKKILIASDYGSPQKRKRAIVGDFIIPKITHNQESEVKIIDICKSLGPPLKNKKKVIKDILFDFKIKKEELTDHFYDGKIPEVLWEKAKRLKTDHGFMGKMDFPDNLNRTSRTIMATESYCSREAIIFPSEDGCGYRAPTIREISCLMGFPINYQFKGNHNSKHKQIGNAVCVQLSHALANAINQELGIKNKKIKQREIVKLGCEQKTPLFLNYIENPKKINSIFKQHIPYMKIKSLRVELDNSESNFLDENIKEEIKEQKYDNLKLVWKCYLHKGSGKGAKKIYVPNSELEQVLDMELIDKLKLMIDIETKDILYSAKLFQIKNCKIENSDIHLSPNEVLNLIKKILEDLIDEEFINYKIFENETEKLLPKPKKILYGLYCLNYIISKLP